VGPITKRKKKLEKQTSLDAVYPTKKKIFLKANEKYNCNFICSYIKDPHIENNVEFCENMIKLMKATQELDLKKILICFDKSEMRVYHGSDEKNLLNIQYFGINNPKLKILLIKENVQFNQHIVYLLTDVCTNRIETIQSNFPELFNIQKELNTKENENDIDALENLLHGLQNKLEKMKKIIITYHDINNFLFNFRKWINNYSELI
jgi:hypothetical protein